MPVEGKSTQSDKFLKENPSDQDVLSKKEILETGDDKLVVLKSETKEAEVQFDCFVPLTDNLQNVYIAGQKLFVIQGDLYQSFHWEECGLRLSCPQGALSSSDERCEVAIVALAGGQFKFPVGTKLVSAIYAISVSKTLLKPLTLELQHCVALETKAQADCLLFVRAPHVGCDPNAEFTIMEGGKFYPGSWYGSITRSHFCKVGVVQKETATTDVNAAANSVTYFCKVYYEKIAPLEWSVKLSIVRRLKSLEEYMRKKHPEAVAHCFDTVLPSGKSFKFVLDNKPPQGWSIHQFSYSEFEYRFIDKFVSDELPEPPSCLVIIKAKHDPDTAEIFHYPVPLAGVNKPSQIFLFLSIRSVSPVQGPRAIKETYNMMFDIEKASRIVQAILRKHYDSLCTLLHSDFLQRVTQGMYAADLVSSIVSSSPNFNNLMGEYSVMLRVCRDHSKFITYCRTFIRILFDQGGPLKMISEVIADDWEKEIKEQLHISLNFTAEH